MPGSTKGGLPSRGSTNRPGSMRSSMPFAGRGLQRRRSALQSPFRSGIVIEDYQLDPVVRGLQMPRVNLLIADDVGLGKTIGAGLVAQELMLRHRARTIWSYARHPCRSSGRTRCGTSSASNSASSIRADEGATSQPGIHANPWRLSHG